MCVYFWHWTTSLSVQEALLGSFRIAWNAPTEKERPEIRVETVLPVSNHKSSNECRLSLRSLFCESRSVFSWEGNEKHSTTLRVKISPFISKSVNNHCFLFVFFDWIYFRAAWRTAFTRWDVHADWRWQWEGPLNKQRLNSASTLVLRWQDFFRRHRRTPRGTHYTRLHCLHPQWFFLPPLLPFTLRAM